MTKETASILTIILLAFLHSAAYGQINLEVPGSGFFDDDLYVCGSLYAGSESRQLTYSGYILGAALLAESISSTQLGNNAVTEYKIANNSISAAKLKTASVSTANLQSASVTPAKLDATQTYYFEKLGLGTSAVPHGDTGYSDLAIDGPDADYNCPAIQMTTTADNYPIMNISAWSHNSAAIRFDCYYANATPMQRSSSSGSNAAIIKSGNELMLTYNSGVAAGNGFSWTHGFHMSCTDGSIEMFAPYGDALPSQNYPIPLYIDNTGKLGYPASSIEVKENIRDTTVSDTGFVYSLRPVMFDYKGVGAKNQCGLIAEEVETVCPRSVIHKRDVAYLPPADPSDPNSVSEPVVTTTDIPVGVNYESLIVPMLAEMQRLKQRIDELEARLAAVEQP